MFRKIHIQLQFKLVFLMKPIEAVFFYLLDKTFYIHNIIVSITIIRIMYMNMYLCIVTLEFWVGIGF